MPMKINIIRGSNQIGGNIIEVSTTSTKVLLDVGLELDNEKNKELPDVAGLFDPTRFFDYMELVAPNYWKGKDKKSQWNNLFNKYESSRD